MLTVRRFEQSLKGLGLIAALRNETKRTDLNRMNAMNDSLLNQLFEDVELCYKRSDEFNDEKRAALLAAAKDFRGVKVTVRRT